MNKTTMAQAINTINSLFGEEQLVSSESLNYKQMEELFTQKLDELCYGAQDLKELWMSKAGNTEVESQLNFNLEDDPTEEVNQFHPQMLFKRIGFTHKVSARTMAEIMVSEYTDTNGNYINTFCVDVDYYKNNSRMYELIRMVQNLAKRKGAKCYIERPPRGQAFLVINWGKRK